MQRLFRVIVFVSAASLIVGCSSTPSSFSPPLVKVEGTVTLDGKAMDGGEARFNLQGQPAQILPIKGGQFSGDAFVGKNRVDILWEKDGPRHPMEPGKFLQVNVVADKFSGPKSPFNSEIGANGATGLKFEVTSARK